MWEENIGKSIQHVLCDVLEARFVSKTKARPPTQHVVKLFFKIVKIRNIVAKDGKIRDVYCTIEYGNLDGPMPSKHDKNPDRVILETKTVSSNTPVFDQHITIPTKNVTDKIAIFVWDRKKEEFLGCIRLKTTSLISTCAKDGFCEKWFELKPRDDKKKDKYVGGEAFLEFNILEDNVPLNNLET